MKYRVLPKAKSCVGEKNKEKDNSQICVFSNQHNIFVTELWKTNADYHKQQNVQGLGFGFFLTILLSAFFS